MANPLIISGKGYHTMKHNFIPFPAYVTSSTGSFVVSTATEISTEPSGDLKVLGDYLSEQIGKATGIRNVVNSASGDQNDGNIRLALDGDTALGEEGYELSISVSKIKVSANRLAGCFYAMQTHRQLLRRSPAATH